MYKDQEKVISFVRNTEKQFSLNNMEDENNGCVSSYETCKENKASHKEAWSSIRFKTERNHKTASNKHNSWSRLNLEQNN